MHLTLVDNMVMPGEGDLGMLDVHPHLGLLSLAAAAEASGHTVDIYDPKRMLRSGQLRYDDELYDRATAAILARHPDAVGFTTLGCSFMFAINVAALLKRAEPELPILLGGPHATMLDRPILERFDQFDVIVRHEADQVFPDVLGALPARRFEAIEGLSWRDSGGELRFTAGKPIVTDLDSLPLLSYDHYPIADLGLDLLRIEAGRGCPFRCTFCSTAGFFQRSFRLKSPERLVTELERLRTLYGYSDVKLDHDMFTVNKRKVLDFCEAVAGRGFRWRASARVDRVDDGLLERMADAGCVGLYFGIESGSARLQQIMKKGLDVDRVEHTLQTAEALGIETTASFITGFPSEERQDQDDTLDLVGRCLRTTSITQLHILQPEPGTPMYEEFGSAIEYDGYSSPFNTHLLTDDDHRLVTTTPSIFQTYYFYATALPRSDHVFAVETVELLRRIGPRVAAYMLRGFDGRLSRLVSDLRTFCADRTAGGSLSPTAFADFVADRFGAQHHLTSLVRLGLLLHDPRVPTASPASDAYDPTTTYVLDADVYILTEMHDPEVWMQRIAGSAGNALLDDDGHAETSLVVRRGIQPPSVHRVDDGAVAVLELFDEPRRPDQLIERLGLPPTDAIAVHELIEGLARSTLLVPSPGIAFGTEDSS